MACTALMQLLLTAGIVVAQHGEAPPGMVVPLPAAATTTFDKTFSYLESARDWRSQAIWTCNGMMQSPIAISSSSTPAAPTSIVSSIEQTLISNIPTGILGTVSNLTLSNKGGTIQVGFGRWTPNWRIISDVVRQYGNETLVWETFNRTIGHPLQMHWHSFSENVVDGRIYPTELHIVRNQSASQCRGDDHSCLAVFSVFFSLPSNPYRNASVPIVKEIMETSAVLTSEKTRDGKYVGETLSYGSMSIELAELFPTDPSFYRFNGSLTTPPCTEGVEWTVFKQAQPIDLADWELLQGAVARGFGEIATNRLPQPLNDRTVYSVDLGSTVSAAGR